MPLRDEDLPPGIVRSKPIAPFTAPAPPSASPRRAAVTAPPTEQVNGSRITALEPQQKRTGRVNVFIDGKFALGLFEDVVLTLGLRLGQQITPERLEEIAQAETLRKAVEDAYNLLSFRARAEKELAERLQRKGYEEAVIVQVVERLRGAGYLNDESFARSWVEGRGKTLGRRALAYELRQKGIDNDTVSLMLAEAKPEESEEQTARLVAVRKVGDNPADKSREARAKLAAFLQRRGFGWDTIRPVLADLYRVRDEGEGDEGTADPENSDNE